MIASVSGRVKAIRKQTIVVDVGGIGLQVAVVNALLEGQTAVGQPIDLYTHMHVREAEISLYGFLTMAELDLFTALLRVSGVGPRTALAVLSTFSPETLRSAIAQGNLTALTRIPGIGAKTAQRLVLDLKDKIGLTASAVAFAPLHEGDADVINALTALGYSLAEAQTALRAIPPDVESLDQRILAALRSLGSG